MPIYRIEQKITAFVNQYRVYSGNESQDVVGFVEQKRFAFREKFELFSAENKSELTAVLQARQVIDLGARYDITDPSGHKLGVIGKDFKQSLLRSTWLIWPADESAPIATVRERSLGLAVFRRLWGFIPVVGELPFFAKYHFEFIAPDGRAAGSYVKTTLLRDHYLLEIDDQLAATADWRVFVSLGIMLDALQSR